MSKTKAHIRVPHEWLKSEGDKIPDAAFKLYIILLSYSKALTGECWPGQETLASRMGKTSREIRRLIKILEKLELVKVEHYGCGRTNKYWVNQPNLKQDTGVL